MGKITHRLRDGAHLGTIFALAPLLSAPALVARFPALDASRVIVRPCHDIQAAGLRKLRVRVHKVRGARDQSDEFIRLADAVAGGVRDSIEGDAIMRPLFEQAARHGIVREV